MAESSKKCFCPQKSIAIKDEILPIGPVLTKQKKSLAYLVLKGNLHWCHWGTRNNCCLLTI